MHVLLTKSLVAHSQQKKSAFIHEMEPSPFILNAHFNPILLFSRFP